MEYPHRREARTPGTSRGVLALRKAGRWLILSLLAGALGVHRSQAQEPAPESAAQTNSVTQASFAIDTNHLASFRVEPGFRIELVAAEPMLAAPMAMAFDEDGRLFVAEMPDYPDRRDTNPHLGRVRMLEGIDEEGRFQHSVVYTDDVAWPSGVTPYAGGVFVATTPDIVYLKDSKHDGVADIKKVVLTGFGGTNAPDGRRLLNSFVWGLDNRIHGVTAGIGGVVAAPNWPSGPVSLAGADFSFDPRSLQVFPETGPSQSGLSFDTVGHQYSCDEVRPLRLAMYSQRYPRRNPFYLSPPESIDVIPPVPVIFSAGPASALRVPSRDLTSPSARTTEILSPTWLTNAQGVLVYRGSAFPTNYFGNAFVADPTAHAIHRQVLRSTGLEVIGERPAEERRSEFLVSTDPSFRPVQVTTGPDGAMYILDRQDSEERGRIYRVVPTGFKRTPAARLGNVGTYALVAALASSDSWHCDTAARLLYEQQGPAAPGLLTNMLQNSKLGLARMRALHMLDGLGALREGHILRGLRDSDARVREHAVLLSERLVANGVISDGLWGQLRSLADDPALAVRYQLAFTAGEISRPDRAVVLATILRRDFGNRWIRNAVLSSCAQGAGNLFVVLANDPAIRNDNAGFEFLCELATMVGAKGQLEEVREVTAFCLRPQLDRLHVFGGLAALGEGLRNTGSSLVMASPQAGLQRIFSVAMECAIDSFSPPAARLQAVRLTGVSTLTYTETSDWLLMLCNPPVWPEMRATAINTLAHYDETRAVFGLLDRWRTFPPFLRNQAIAALLGRRSHVGTTLLALEQGRIPIADLSSPQRDFLRTYADPVISERARRLLGPTTVHRPAVLDLYKPALRLTGISERGQPIFAARCAGCHLAGGVGQNVGPSLAAVRGGGKEKLLQAIIEPNAELTSGYETSVIFTRDGSNLLGIAAEDTLESVVLRQPGGGGIACPRLNITQVQTQSWSLMPEGLEQGLTPQGMADLLEFILAKAR
jgi:putative membrane-bound dehydrogenase-like protein